MSSLLVKSKVRLYQTNNGSNPIRTWLMRLSSQERKQVYEELRAAQIAYMVGLPIGERIEEQTRILERFRIACTEKPCGCSRRKTPPDGLRVAAIPYIDAWVVEKSGEFAREVVAVQEESQTNLVHDL